MPRKDGAARRAYRGPRDLEVRRPAEVVEPAGRAQGTTIRDAPPTEEGLPKDPRSLRVHLLPADVLLGGENEEGILDLPPEERADAVRAYVEQPQWSEEDEKQWRLANR